MGRGSHVRLVPAELRVQASPEVLQGLRRAQGLGLGRKAGGREAAPTASFTERAAQRPWGKKASDLNPRSTACWDPRPVSLSFPTGEQARS